MLTCQTTGKGYVGQVMSYDAKGKRRGPLARWTQHKYSAKTQKGSCPYIERAIAKYGPEDFTVETLLICNSALLDMYEEKFISQYDTLKPGGYNLVSGGNSTKRYPEEVRRRIGESNRGLVVDFEGRQNIGKASKYRNMCPKNQERLRNALGTLGLGDLPMYICMSVDRRHKPETDRVHVRVPDRPSRQFGRKDMSLLDKIKLAIEYKKSLT